MKNLIISGVETTIAKPSHLSVDGATEDTKAIWSEECDVCLKDKKSHDERKMKHLSLHLEGAQRP